MNTNVRIVLDDDGRRRWKEIFGEDATRVNIKFRVATMVFHALGDETPKKTALRTVGISDKGKAAIRKKNGLGGNGKPKFVLKK
jgi:hypothetical protein